MHEETLRRMQRFNLCQEELASQREDSVVGGTTPLAHAGVR
jgi:hypothetical protein